MSMQTIIAHPADAALFDDILSHEAHLPAAFVPGGAGRLSHAESLLRNLALIEDSGREDNQSERDDATPFRQRLEAKFDLNLLMLGRLLEQARAPLPACEVRWSIRGARLEHSASSGLSHGSEGALRIQPCEWLPDLLELPARVMDVEAGGRIWLSFPGFSPNMHDALERHLFRQHRRQIARSRIASGCG